MTSCQDIDSIITSGTTWLMTLSWISSLLMAFINRRLGLRRDSFRCNLAGKIATAMLLEKFTAIMIMNQ